MFFLLVMVGQVGFDCMVCVLECFDFWYIKYFDWFCVDGFLNFVVC